jgi:hypothetical protein
MSQLTTDSLLSFSKVLFSMAISNLFLLSILSHMIK